METLKGEIFALEALQNLLIRLVDLPNGYLPSKDSLFEKEYCSNYQKLWLFIHSETTQPPSGGFFLSFKNEKNSQNTEGAWLFHKFIVIKQKIKKAAKFVILHKTNLRCSL